MILVHARLTRYGLVADDDGSGVLLKLGKYSDGPSARTRPVSGVPNGGRVDRLCEEEHLDVAAACVAGDDGIGGNVDVIDGHLDTASGDTCIPVLHPRECHHANEQTRRDPGHHEIAGRRILGNGAGGSAQDGTAKLSPAALSLMRRYDTKVRIPLPLSNPCFHAWAYARACECTRSAYDPMMLGLILTYTDGDKWIQKPRI